MMMLTMMAAGLVGANPICAAGEPTSFVGLAVEEVDEARDYYVDVLGFTLTRTLTDPERPTVYLLSCGSTMLELVPSGGPIPQRPEGGGLNGGPFKFGIVTADFEVAHAWLVDRNIEIAFGPVTDDSGIRFLLFRDVAGNVVQLFEDLTPGDEAEARSAAAIADAARSFSAAYVAEDIETLVGFYTEDGVGIPNARPPVVGREALLDYWQIGEGVDVLRHKTVSDELVIEGDLAYDRGTFEGAVERGGEVSEFGGNYLIVWRRGGDGKWRMAQDMWANR